MTMVSTVKTVSAKKRVLMDHVKVLHGSLREEKISLEKLEISKQRLRKEVDDLVTRKETVGSLARLAVTAPRLRVVPHFAAAIAACLADVCQCDRAVACAGGQGAG